MKLFSHPRQTSAARLQKRFDKMDHGQKGYLDRQDWSGS